MMIRAARAFVFIPACAGYPCLTRAAMRSRSVYPRLRGVSRVVYKPISDGRRSIPARAGYPPSHSSMNGNSRVYPRPRGVSYDP